MRSRVWWLAAAAGLLVVACGAAGPRVTATESRQAEGDLLPTDTKVTGDTTPDIDYPVLDDVVDFGEAGPRHPEYDGFLTAAFGDIQEFWASAYPETYEAEWEPLSGGIYAAYPSREALIPACGDEPSSYTSVAAKGAFYCIAGDFMAYDDDALLPSLVAELGKEAVAVVLAHEFGHAVQARAPGSWNQPVVLKEQQADCFAGAWSAHVASGASDLIRFTDRDVQAGLIAMINVRDPVDGNGLDDPQAHGTGFDRVGAFQDGFVGGPLRCKPIFDEGRPLVDIPFDRSDPNAGNLPLFDPTGQGGDIVTLIPQSLDQFWTALASANGVPFTPPTVVYYPAAGPYPSCEGVDESRYRDSVFLCEASNTIMFDQDFATSLSSDPLLGDMSVGYLISDAYSDAIQVALRSRRAGEQRALFSDCLTGAWTQSIVPPTPDDSVISLSAGDLDEAIVTAIIRGDRATDTDVNGSAFEKIDAFRLGVLGGLNECRSRLG